MGDRVEAFFEGTDGAIRFSAPDLADRFREVVHSWPLVEGPGPLGPFAQVTSNDSEWSIDILRPELRQTSRDAVNGICDLIVELNWSRLRQNTKLLCMHAAGIEMGSSLVVFPSGRRAGKSTLSAELARRGYRVFSDDVLAIDLDADGVAQGLATGVAPRLRVPLPASASDGFRDWVHGDPGPGNRQYKYLTKAPVAPFGTSCPIGAIVTLDRQDEATKPAFSEMDVKEVLPLLIYQNFGRFAHAGRTLAALAAIVTDLPCLKLSYSDFEEAADFLETAASQGVLEGAAVAQARHGSEPDFNATNPLFDPVCAYRQRGGLQCVRTGEEAFIADAHGIGIFRMGPGMMPIWLLLEEPMSAGDIVSVLSELYPDMEAATIERDVLSGLRQLNDAGLIEPAGA